MALGRNKLIGGAMLVVLIGGGWMLAQHEAGSIAKSKIDNFLVDNQLASEVVYGSVTASPFGSASLHDVALYLGQGAPPLRIGTVSVSGLPGAGQAISNVSITARNLDIPVLAMMQRSPYGPEYMRELVGLGYANLVADLSLKIDTDNTDQTVTISSAGKIEDLGKWNLTLGLAGVNIPQLGSLPPLIQGLINGLTPDQQQELQNVPQHFGNAAIRQADLMINDRPIFARATQIPASPTPPDGTTAAAPMVSQYDLVQAGLPPFKAAQIAGVFKSWAQNGGALYVQASPGPPLPLFNQQQSDDYDGLFAPAFSDLASYLAASNSTVSN